MTVLEKVFGDIHNFLRKMFTKIETIPVEIYKLCNELYPLFVTIKADLESGKAIAIASVIPGAEPVREDFLAALNAALTALGYVEGLLHDKYNAYIAKSATQTEAERNGLLVKALSLSTAALHGNTAHESVYDTAAQTTAFNHISA